MWRWVLAFVLAGCVGPDAADPKLVPGDAPDASWMLHTTGCGFCGGDGPWADTLVLGQDGGVLWFSFRPPNGMEGDTWDGIDIPAEHEELRAEITAALDVLMAEDVYWTRQGDVRIYEARTYSIDDWQPLRMRLESMAHGLQDPPPIEDHGCHDCSMPIVHVVDEGVVGGAIQQRGSFGPGTGNVERGSAWHVIEGTLGDVHDHARGPAP